MDSHTLHAVVVFLLLALFGALMFWLASWASNRRVLSSPEDDDENELFPAEVALLARRGADVPEDEADDGPWPLE